MLIRLLTLFTEALSAQTINITGLYLDKKSNPLDKGTVEYLAEGGEPVNTDITATNGSFTLTLEVTGIKERTLLSATLVDNSSRNEMTADFTLVPDDFPWDLYLNAFRDSTLFTSESHATISWFDKAIVHIFSDNSFVGETNITVNYNNMIYNLENLLPNFNDVEFDVDDVVVVEHETFGYQLLAANLILHK